MRLINPTLYEILPRIWKHPPRSTLNILVASPPKKAGQTRLIMATSSGPNFAEYGIESTHINTAPGVTLSESQQLLTGSILDLFAGRPTQKKLSLWTEDATFADPLTIATGRKKYAAQWYGLPAAFSEIKPLSSSVTSAGNPIEIDMKTMYKVKGIGTEHTIESKVKIWNNGEQITRVEDRWNDELPDGHFKNAMRKLNSVVVPGLVSVPSSEQEEAKKKL